MMTDTITTLVEAATSLRETAIVNARGLAQDLWVADYTQDHYQTTYYVERDGRITSDRHIGAHERESVYYNHEGCAASLTTVGRSGVGYDGYEEDYRNMDETVAYSSEMIGQRGEQWGDKIDAPSAEDIAAKLGVEMRTDGGLHWDADGSMWRPLEADCCAWQDRDGDDPSNRLVDAIECLPFGWFADEHLAEDGA